jgi:hypothetical protein
LPLLLFELVELLPLLPREMLLLLRPAELELELRLELPPLRPGLLELFDLLLLPPLRRSIDDVFKRASIFCREKDSPATFVEESDWQAGLYSRFKLPSDANYDCSQKTEIALEG